MVKKPTKGKKTSRKAPARGGRQEFSVKQVAGKHLVIVESPTKARTINKYLGPEYFVMASVGHVRDLPSRNPKGVTNPVPGVDLENDFEPTYEILPSKKDIVGNLKKASKVATDVWFATDLDREGEAIAWHLAKALDVPVDSAKRVVFNAITRDEIANAFSHPRNIQGSRVDAQQARRILDRIVGYQVSPLLWKKIGGGLSAGRVQSVATRLVVDRESEIDAFIPDEYWKVTGIFNARPDEAAALVPEWHDLYYRKDERGVISPPIIKDQNAWLAEHGCLRAELHQVDGRSFKVDNRDAALSAARGLGFDLQDTLATEDPRGKGPGKNLCTFLGRVNPEAPGYRITSTKTKRTVSRPPAPFITSTLQQQASTRLGFNLKRTMRVAQQLYEGIDLKGSQGQVGLITYMRTDSTTISGEALGMARDYIESTRELGKEYLPEKPNFFRTSDKKAQEAHEAIRPTDVKITPDSIRSALTDEQFNLYNFIWCRFVACQMNPAQWDSTTILIGGQDGTPAARAFFKASGRVLVFDGYLKIAGLSRSDELLLPALEDGQDLGLVDINPSQHFTSPPARFTEASLQKKLEEEGIGRPSTYAAIIGTIQDRQYVETLTPRDKRLCATHLGKKVTELLVKAFPRILDVGYTREMEAELDRIESDNKNWRDTLREFYGPFSKALASAHENVKHIKMEIEPAPDDLRCSKCGAPTCYRFGRNGRFLGCTKYDVDPEIVKPEGHEGTYLLYKAKGKARPKLSLKNSGEKLGWMKLTKADKEKFQALSDQMPERCNYAAPVDREGQPMEPEQTDIICPLDGRPMIKRTGRYGPFLASQGYPEIQFILNIDPKTGAVKLPRPKPVLTDLPCPKCGADLYLRDSKRGLWMSCSTFPRCRGREAFGKLPEEKQEELTVKWDRNLVENPVPDIKTVDGRSLQEDEPYIPIIVGKDEPEQVRA